jgi:hypothetical protein
MLLLFGAFLFAFTLNCYVIHEAGHALGGVLFGCQFEGLHVNPFGIGGWADRCPDTMPLAGKFVRGMGGEIFGLPLSIAVTILLWRKRSPIWLPLLMSATVVCIGNVLSVLSSVAAYPGYVYDYGWMLQVGVPPFVLGAIGIASLVFGIILMNLLAPLAGVGTTERFWKVLIVNLAVWPLFFLVRLIYLTSGGVDAGGPLSFVFEGVIVATITALTFKPVCRLADRITHTEPIQPPPHAAWPVIGLGLGLTLTLMATNPVWFGG